MHVDDRNDSQKCKTSRKAACESGERHIVAGVSVADKPSCGRVLRPLRPSCGRICCGRIALCDIPYIRTPRTFAALNTCSGAKFRRFRTRCN